MNLRETLGQIHKNVETLKTRSSGRKSPENLLLCIAIPFGQALGYNVFDPEETETENLPANSILLKPNPQKADAPAILFHCLTPGTAFNSPTPAVTKSILAVMTLAAEKNAGTLILTNGNEFQVHTCDLEKEAGKDQPNWIPAFNFSSKGTLPESLGKIQMLEKAGFDPANIHAFAISETRNQALQQAFHSNLVNPTEPFFTYAATLLGLDEEESQNEEFRETARTAYQSFFRRMITRRLEAALEQHLEETKPSEKPQLPQLPKATPRKETAAPGARNPRESSTPEDPNKTEAGGDNENKEPADSPTPENPEANPEANPEGNPGGEGEDDKKNHGEPKTTGETLPVMPEGKGALEPADIFQSIQKTLVGEIEDSRLSLTETSTYYAVILDGKPRQRVCRIYNNIANNGYKITYENGKPQIEVAKLEDIDEHSEKFKESLKRILATGEG